MSRLIEQGDTATRIQHRRSWLFRAASGGVFLAAIAKSPGRADATQDKKKSPAEEAAGELERATSRVRAVTSHSLQVAISQEYQVVGDADPTFIQTSLRDYDAIASDFLAHYQARGFQVKAPERRMTLVAFVDERPFREFARKFARGVPPKVSGFYSRPENWLVLFDFRNVPASALGGALKNVRVLAHEATHQLTFNTGLLNRQGDVPAAIMEGLACYGEARRLRGRSELGLLNGERLDDLAHIRRRAQWIKLADLLTDDSPSAGGSFDQMQLFYAQSWLLIYSLMNTPARLPQLQSYFKTIFPRVDKKKRLDDAGKCFGNLDQLNQELRREAIRLQTEPRP
jgi:Protein of unknown function (DUF1570)